MVAASDDLTAKMRAWAHQVEKSYGRNEPAGSLTVTVQALTGIDGQVQEPFWMAAVSGSVDEMGTGTRLKAATESLPKGTLSWSEEPLTLPVHDIASDLLLLLCESEGTAATRACVGRVVLPLADLLPLNPWAAGVQTQVWADVFPPAAEYGAGQVHPTLAATLEAVPGSGMARPPSGQAGKALISLDLALNKNPFSAYMSTAPFDSHMEHPGSSRHERPPLAPERLLLVASRFDDLFKHGLTPACVRYARSSSPWIMGGLLFAAVFLGCYHTTLATSPWLLLLLYVLNAISLRALTHASPPAWESSRTEPRSEDPSHLEGAREPGVGLVGATADVRLRRLEDTLAPLLVSLEALASNLERCTTAPVAADPRAAILSLLPIVSMVAASCMCLYIVSAFILIAGGPKDFVFDAGAVLFLWNLAAFHHRELKECMGTEDDLDDLEQERSEAAKNPFAARARSATAAQRSLEAAEDGEWLDSERRSAASNLASSLWRNIWERIPDAPTQAHRAIAKSANQPVDAAGGGPCLC